VAGWLARARASIALCTGDAGAFLDRAEEAAAFFTAAGDVRIACVQRSLAGFGWLEVGAPARAEAVLREALEVGSRLGASTVETAAKQNLGLALARQGRFDEAIDVEREAVATCVAARDRRMEPGCRTYLAIALTAAGRHDEAAEEARTAAAIARDAAPMLAFSLATHARIELARGDAASAVSLATKAAALLDELGTIEEGEATVRLAHAEALLATGDVVGARAVIATAAARLQTRSERIASPVTRRSFLEDVPDNARTLALRNELLA
jgi:tetratricopeptide (TPR) repeat protein